MFFLKNANIGGFVVGNFIFISPLGQCLTALIAKMAFNQNSKMATLAFLVLLMRRL